jgi:hypothetical protein
VVCVQMNLGQSENHHRVSVGRWIMHRSIENMQFYFCMNDPDVTSKLVSEGKIGIVAGSVRSANGFLVSLRVRLEPSRC